MPIYKIKIEKSAQKFILSRTKQEQKRIYSAIMKLPDCSGVKKMKGENKNLYRLRIGDIRVIYEKYDDIFIIIVIDVGNRGEIYKKY